MSATAQATNATETLPPAMATMPVPCVHPNDRAAAAIAATRRRGGTPSEWDASGAAHVDETHIAELDAHIIPIYHQRARRAKVERRCAGRRLTRALQHKAQPRREGVKPGFAERHRAGRQCHVQRAVAQAHQRTVEPRDQAVAHGSVCDMLRHASRRRCRHPRVAGIRRGRCRRQSRCCNRHAEHDAWNGTR